MNTRNSVVKQVTQRYVFIQLLLWSLSPSCSLFGQRESGTPFIRNYSKKEYGAKTQNWSMVQNQRGIMYFANGDGVLEYDGATWRKIPITNHTAVRSLAIGGNGRVYLGATSDFGYLDADSIGQTQYISLLSHLSLENREFSDVWKTYTDQNGVYYQTSSMIVFIDHALKKSQTWRAKSAFHSSYMVNNRFYVREVGRGLFFLEGDSLKEAPGGRRFAKLRIYAMLAFDDKRLLIATREEGLFLYDGHAAHPFSSPARAFLTKHQVYCGISLHDSTFVFGSLSGGALVMDRQGAVVRIFDESAGLQDDAVLNLFEDNQRGLWLGLDNGISRIELSLPITFLGEKDGLKGTVYSVSRYLGTLYVGTNVGIFRMQTDDIRTPEFIPLKGITSQSWAFWSDGDVFLAGNAEGVYRINGDKTQLIQRWAGPRCFLRSKFNADKLFVGLSHGLGILERRAEHWHAAGIVEGIRDNIRTICEAEDGRLWLGTASTGLLRVTPGSRNGAWKIDRFGPTHGLPLGQINVVKLNDGFIFAGRGGLYRLDEQTGRFNLDTLIHPLLSDDSTRLSDIWIENGNGRVWMYNYAKEKSETVIAIPQADGSYKIERGPLARIPDFGAGTIYPEPNGIVWLGGPDGLARYNTQAQTDYRSSIKAIIRRVAVGPDSVVYAGATANNDRILSVPYSLNTFRIEFSAPFFDQTASTLYQHFLEGFDKDWSTWTADWKKDFTNLPNGRYKFLVRAKNVYGNVSHIGSFEFVILPPWYLTFWAWALYIGGFTSVIFVIVKWRSRHLERDRRHLEQIVAERTEQIRRKNIELTELNNKKNEFMGIAAHDLRNPLNGINGMLGLIREDLDTNQVEPSLWKDDIKAMQDSIRRMMFLVESMLDISAIESGKLELHLKREDLNLAIEECVRIHHRRATQKNIQVNIVKAQGGAEAEVDIYRIMEVVDNLLSNAIKYTFAGGRVTVASEVHSSEVVVSVQDTGQGLTDDDLKQMFTSFKKLSARPTGGERSTGLGLVIAKKIIEQHGGKIWVDSKLGVGTTFKFSLPKSESAQRQNQR